jgi:hypothetical protein
MAGVKFALGSAGDGDNPRPDRRGEHGISVKPLRRESRIASAGPVCSWACFFVHVAHETAGAACIRLSLRPLIGEGGKLIANLGHSKPRERERMSDCLRIKIDRRPGQASGASADPGPITTGFSCCAKAVGRRLSKRRPRRMGPGVRRDDVERFRATRRLAMTDYTDRRWRNLSRTEITAMAMPMHHGSTAPNSRTLKSMASRLVTKHSTFGVPACPANDSRKGRNRTSSVPAVRAVMRAVRPSGFEMSKSADRSRARSAAGFGDPLAAIAGRTAVIAVMTGDIMEIADRRRRRSPRTVADEGGRVA